ncbi:carbohydrate ABC transporter permease [Cutibacterium namnetense]|uniref:carbohydrate ABC transporter permease n=1 Tax=Cutibacterium namnetense TaxID=1574624 RepID=UPI00254FFBFA|nr:sugar ABC transporter permease [Cutibacterium namnetense]
MRSPVIAMHGSQDAEEGKVVVDTPHRRNHRRWSFDRMSFFVVFLGVPLTIYLVFVISPFLQALYYSLTDWGGFSMKFKIVGLENYRILFADPLFRRAMLNNVILCVFVPLVAIASALALATMLTVGGSSHGQIRGLRGSGFYRVVSFFPYCVPVVVIGLLWSQLLDPSHGLVNGLLKGAGLGGFDNFAWLGERSTAMPVSIFIMLWGYIGFYMLLFVAAIKSIPSEIFEAAKIGGAGRFRVAVKIMVPLIRDNIQTAWIYLGIVSLDAFVYMSVLNPFGGSDNSTLVMSQQLWDSFQNARYGLACAQGVVICLFTLTFAGIVGLVSRLTGGKDSVTLA